MANPLDIKGIMRKAIQRLSEKNSATPSEVAVKIFLHPATQRMAFRLFVKGQPIKMEGRGEEGLMSFNKDILNQPVDLMAREELLNQLVVPPAIQKFATEAECSPLEMSIMIGTVNNETCEPYLYLYKGSQDIRQLFIEKDF